ncbi:MAG: hypothetical protein ACRCUY_08650 [Thermoguttaceae bacterium]
MNFNLSRYFLLFLISGALLLLLGCSKEQRPKDLPPLEPTIIQVMQGGKPLADAIVSLKSEDDPNFAWGAVGRSDASGNATVAAKGMYNGAVAGRYKVVVSKFEMASMPDPYADAPDIKTDFEAYQGWLMKNEAKIAAAQRKEPKSYTLIDPIFASRDTTTLSVEITKGKNRHTVDVGQPIRKEYKEVIIK